MRLHVIPVGDTVSGKRVEHAASGRCRCNPLPEDINGHTMYIHHAFDLREKWERQDVWHEYGPWTSVEEL
jgi:hypothetical protein